MVLIIVAGAMMINDKDIFGIKLPTALITSGKFGLIYENSYYVEDGKTLKIDFGVEGASSGEGSDKVSALALTFSNIPDFLSNPKIVSNKTNWNVNLGNVSDQKIIFTAEGTQNPLTKDESSVITISFSVSDPEDYILEFEGEIVDGSIPGNYLKESGEINLNVQSSSNFSLMTVQQVAVKSNSEFSIPIGVKGAQNVDSEKVNTLSVRFSGLPDYVTECSASSNMSNWSAYVGDLSNGSIQMTATGSGNPLTTDVEGLIDLNCKTSVVSADSEKVTLNGELTTLEKSEKFTLSSEYVTLVPQGVSSEYYSISGTVSGDTKSGVLVICGPYNAVSDSTGSYDIENIPAGTNCTMVANKSGYTFSPETISVSAISSDLSGYDFEAEIVKGEKGEKGDKGDEGDDGDDGDDGKDGEVTYVAPKSGPAEDIIIGSAIFLGLLGSIVFVGAKLKWFA